MSVLYAVAYHSSSKIIILLIHATMHLSNCLSWEVQKMRYFYALLFRHFHVDFSIENIVIILPMYKAHSFRMNEVLAGITLNHLVELVIMPTTSLPISC